MDLKMNELIFHIISWFLSSQNDSDLEFEPNHRIKPNGAGLMGVEDAFNDDLIKLKQIKENGNEIIDNLKITEEKPAKDLDSSPGSSNSSSPVKCSIPMIDGIKDRRVGAFIKAGKMCLTDHELQLIEQSLKLQDIEIKKKCKSKWKKALSNWILKSSIMVMSGSGLIFLWSGLVALSYFIIYWNFEYMSQAIDEHLNITSTE